MCFSNGRSYAVKSVGIHCSRPHVAAWKPRGGGLYVTNAPVSQGIGLGGADMASMVWEGINLRGRVASIAATLTRNDNAGYRKYAGHWFI